MSSFDYNAHGHTYGQHRKTDPRIASQVWAHLEGMQTVLNVGAGAGSYEPSNAYVVAVEPSATMRAQRLALGRIPAVNASAESLPFDDQSFDAVMAMVTVHHWKDLQKGLSELRRVARKRVVVITFDPDLIPNFWNAYYFKELAELEARRMPSLGTIIEGLGGEASVIPVDIPMDCMDGFQEAFYARPEAFLDPMVRKNQSAWGFLQEGQEAALVGRLQSALESGEWEEQFGHHRAMPFYQGSLRLVVM